MSGTSARGERLGGSGLVQLMRLAAKTNVVELALGTPGAPEPSAKLVTEAGYALLPGDHHQYADPIGHPQLRVAIAASLATPADPETEITVTVGGTEGLCAALLSIVDSGDEVVVFEPFYENFIKAIHLAGAVPRFVRLRQPGWHYDPAEFAAAFGSRTRALILNSPNNPTGRILTRTELEEIARVCDNWDVTVISDEVYSSYVYDGATFTSAADVPALSGRSIVVNSLSKSHAISGWRLGYLRAPAEMTTVVAGRTR
ncbi:pyridoxal phosphate-dependent aminotransferase [Lentzea tibetensis]|uniref:pyridoxal phosphate-dependent aminotransferase n=1 Tax=Lentzea tibetensis TaxID=2591470 RepID=UPI001C994EBC|nr:pyridoxal phosphate-dependent aminotransferase [Lentzea tibetensis]